MATSKKKTATKKKIPAKKKTATKKKPVAYKKSATKKKSRANHKSATKNRPATKDKPVTKKRPETQKKSAAKSPARALAVSIAYRAWCDTENSWVSDEWVSREQADNDAQPHIDANHQVEIKQKISG